MPAFDVDRALSSGCRPRSRAIRTSACGHGSSTSARRARAAAARPPGRPARRAARHGPRRHRRRLPRAAPARPADARPSSCTPTRATGRSFDDVDLDAVMADAARRCSPSPTNTRQLRADAGRPLPRARRRGAGVRLPQPAAVRSRSRPAACGVAPGRSSGPPPRPGSVARSTRTIGRRRDAALPGGVRPGDGAGRGDVVALHRPARGVRASATASCGPTATRTDASTSTCPTARCPTRRLRRRCASCPSTTTCCCRTSRSAQVHRRATSAALSSIWIGRLGFVGSVLVDGTRCRHVADRRAQATAAADRPSRSTLTVTTIRRLARVTPPTSRREGARFLQFACPDVDHVVRVRRRSRNRAHRGLPIGSP